MTDRPRGFFRFLGAAAPLAPVYVSVLLFSAGESALHLLVPLHLSENLGLGSAVIGSVVAAFSLASLAARLPAGAAYTAQRARRVLLLAGGLSTVAFLVVPIVRHPLPFAGLLAIDGLGWSLATTTQLAVLVARRPAGLPTAGAMAWYSGFQGLGHAVAGVTAGVLGDVLGFRVGFIVLAAVPAAATLVMIRAIPAGLLGSEEHRHGLRLTLSRLPLIAWMGAVILFAINFISGALNTFHPVLALAAGLSVTEIGTLASSRSLASSAVRLGSGPLFARRGGMNLTRPLLLASAVAMFAIPSVARSFLLQLPLFVTIGLSRGLLRITGSADAFEGGSDDQRSHGLTSALLNAGLDLGKLLGPLAGGLVAEQLGLATMFRVVPLALLVLYFTLDLATRRRRAGLRAAGGG